MTQYLAIHKGPAFSALPEITYTATMETMRQVMRETQGKWQDQCHKYHRASRELKQWRTTRDTQRQLTF